MSSKVKHRTTALAALLTLILLVSINVSGKNLLISDISDVDSPIASCEAGIMMRENIVYSAGLNPDNIAFLNWNIYKGFGENWQSDFSELANAHDVMAIQEARLDDEMTSLLQSFDFDWIINSAFKVNGAAAGVMNAASIRPFHSCGFMVSEPIIRLPKSTLISYYHISGSDKKLLLANVHGINFSLGVSSYKKQLDKLYEIIKQHDGPMIVAGDFNSWSNKRMALVDQLVEKLALSELEYAVNNKTHIFGNAIDHVFYRQLELLDHQVQLVASSDHNPISVTFRVN